MMLNRLTRTSAAIALAFTMSPALAQDCDDNGIPDLAEIGPFGTGTGGSLWLTGEAENAVTPVTPWSFANNSFTIEMWVYRDDVSGNQQYLLSTGEPGSPHAALFVGFRDDDRFVFGFWGNDLETADMFPPDGQWHHWVCRYDTTTNFRWIIRDGVEVAFDVSPTDYLGTATELYLGGLENTLNFSGALGEVRIFASARSDAEIAADMHLQYTETGLPFGLHAYYPLDDINLGADLAAANDAVLPTGSNQLISAVGDANQNGRPDECDRRTNITRGTGHASIQSAINHAIPGDVIELTDGVFTDLGDRSLDFFGKGLTIRSASGDARYCVIDYQNSGTLLASVLRYDDFKSTFQGLTVRNGRGVSTGALVYTWDADFIDCRFIENSVQNSGGNGGGAVYVGGGSVTRFINCVFAGNSVGSGNGGAISVGALTDVVIVNSLITSNTAGFGSGIFADFAADVWLQNTIVWNDGISNTYGVVTADHCIIDTGWAGAGNLDTDPLFFDPDGPDDDPLTFDDNDYRLASNSPAREAGRNANLPADLWDLDNDGDTAEQLPLDLDLHTRVVNGTVDIGPYEHQGPPPCPADLAAPFGTLNFFDVAAFISLYNAGDPAADFAAPFGTLNFFDVAAFIAAYNAGCP